MEKQSKINLWKLPTEGMLFALLVVLCVALAIVKPNFVSQYNLSTLSRSISWTTIVAFGQTLVLLTGGIDLSVAGVAGMSAIIASWFMVYKNTSPLIVIPAVLILAFLCGCINGFLISKGKMMPFIVTLATGEIFTGIIYVITKGSPILNIPKTISFLGQGMLFGFIPYPAILMLIIFAILFYMLKNMPFGRYIYAVGGNSQAANYAGVKVDKTTILVYGISALLAAIAGILITCRLETAHPTVGNDWVMPSVTAAAIGGTSLAGGRGTLLGTLIGGVFVGVLSNAMTIIGVSPYWQQVVTGIIILVVISIDRVKEVKSIQKK